jgi:hypothetical protein
LGSPTSDCALLRGQSGGGGPFWRNDQESRPVQPRHQAFMAKFIVNKSSQPPRNFGKHRIASGNPRAMIDAIESVDLHHQRRHRDGCSGGEHANVPRNGGIAVVSGRRSAEHRLPIAGFACQALAF